MSFLRPQVIFLGTTRLHYFSSNITYFCQKHPIKEQVFRFFTARVKIHQIPYVIFETISRFFTTQLVCIILAKTLHTFGKNIPS